jgi:hypothetical protein
VSFVSAVSLAMLISAIYYLGRCAQVLGMWLLVVDIFTAGPLGPNPRLFALGVAVFLVGWGLTKIRTQGRR